MNILKKIRTAVVKTVKRMLVVVFIFTAGFAVAEVKSALAIQSLETQLSDERLKRLIEDEHRLREEQAVLLARAFYGEYREGTYAQRLLEWELKFSAIYNRLEYSSDWSDDFVTTMLWGCKKLCQINALPLVGEEQLLTPIGQEALAFARLMITALHDGPFVPLHSGHSWATPKAAAADSWFQTLCMVAEGPGHQFFADCPAVAQSTQKQVAPMTSSLRPQLRPIRHDPIILALIEANS